MNKIYLRIKVFVYIFIMSIVLMEIVYLSSSVNAASGYVKSLKVDRRVNIAMSESVTIKPVIKVKGTVGKKLIVKCSNDKVIKVKYNSKKNNITIKGKKDGVAKITVITKSKYKKGKQIRKTIEVNVVKKEKIQEVTTEDSNIEQPHNNTEIIKDDENNFDNIDSSESNESKLNRSKKDEILIGDGWEFSDGVLKISKIHYVLSEIGDNIENSEETPNVYLDYSDVWPDSDKIIEIYVDADLICDNADPITYAGYNVKCPWVLFGNMKNLIKVTIKRLDMGIVKDLSGMFANDPNLIMVDLSGLKTSSVENMSHMFEGDVLLQSVNLDKVSKTFVQDFSYMFHGCSMLTTVNLTGYTADLKPSFHSTFEGCSSLTDVTLGDIYNSDVTGLFFECICLTEPQIGNVTIDEMEFMFDEKNSITNYGFAENWKINEDYGECVINDKCYKTVVSVAPVGLEGDAVVIVDVYYSKITPKWYEKSMEKLNSIEDYSKVVDTVYHDSYWSLTKGSDFTDYDNALDALINTINDSIEDEDGYRSQLLKDLLLFKALKSGGFDLDKEEIWDTSANEIENYVKKEVVKDTYNNFKIYLQRTETDIEYLHDVYTRICKLFKDDKKD